MKRTFGLYIFIAFLLTSLGTIVAVSYASYKMSYQKIEEMIGLKLKSIASTGSLYIDHKAHTKIFKDLVSGKKDIDKTKHFKKVQKQLREIKKVNSLKQDIYTVVNPKQFADKMIFIAMSNKKTYVGNAMDVHPLVKKVYKTKKPQFTSIYHDHEGNWISGFAPIVNKKNKVLAVLEVDFDVNEEVKNIQDDLRDSLLIPSLLILLMLFPITLLFTQTVTMPLSNLLKKVENLAKGEIQESKEPHSKIIEFKNLNLSFDNMAKTIKESEQQIKDYAHNLELKVEERTKELKESKNDIENILNNLSQGFLTFDSQGNIGEGHSKVVTKLFSESPEGKNFLELLSKFNLDYKIEDFESWKDLAFSNTIEFESLSDLLPESFINSSNQNIFLNYRAIYNENKELSKVICISEDKTQEVKFAKELKEKEIFTSFILHRMKFPEVFQDFGESYAKNMEESLTILKSSQIDKNQFENLSRLIHTIKGEASYNHVQVLVKSCGDIEKVIEKSRAELTDSMYLSAKTQEEIFHLTLKAETEFDTFLKENNLEVKNQQKKVITLDKAKLKQYLDLINFENKEEVKEFKKYILNEDASVMFSRYVPMVSKVSKQLGKKVKLHIDSNGLRIDKSFYQDLSNSFVHIIRNSIDHGIEGPEERSEKGKAPIGKININIEKETKENDETIKVLISDDGRGIDYSRILQKALNKGLLNKDKAENLNNEELKNLIFLPGLSSKDEITELSGFGIGLDAVKQEIEKIGGQIFINSTIDKGTTFELKLPLKSI